METSIDMTGATVHNILYRKPKGSKGVFVATISGTKLLYDGIPGDFNEVGIWKLQSFVTAGGLDAYGAITELNVINNLK